MRTYSFYQKYYLSFFLQAAFHHVVLHVIPKVSALKIFFSVFDVTRLVNFYDKLFFFFLIQNSDPRARWSCASSRGLKTPHYLFSTVSKSIDSFYERFIFFNYSFYCTDPIKTLRFSNDTLTVALNGFRFLEQELFRVTDRFVENYMDYTVTARFQFFLTPLRTANLYEQRGLLRSLNLPLRAYEKGA